MDIASKQCTKCGKLKPCSEFYSHGKGPLRSECKPCTFIMRESYRRANREKMVEYNRQFYLDNKEKIDDRSKRYQVVNADKVNERLRKRRAADHEFKTRCYLRSRLSSLVAGARSVTTLELLGIEFGDFMKWMEFQFLDDRMSW